MKSFLISLILGFTSLNAVIVGSNFDQRDIHILNELDIEPSFITDYNLQRTYEAYSRSQDRYKEKLSNATLFVPIINNILRSEGIPSSFLYLAMAESSFTLNAKSRVKAMGLWQFMPTTGRIYGLDNNLYVDERMDLVKSTYAATKYLKQMHKQFGKWYLAAMAYNAGQGRVIEALTRATLDIYQEQNPTSKVKEIERYRDIIKAYQTRKTSFGSINNIYKEVSTWGITPDIFRLMKVQEKVSRQYIPSETRGYIRNIVALGMMNGKSFIANEDSHLLNLGENASSIAKIKVKGGVHILSLADTLGMKYKDLKKLNMHIKRDIVPPYVKEYDIYIPYSKLSLYNINKDSISNDRFLVYSVKSGDSLSSIAGKYKTSYKIIKDFNKLRSNILSINQKLIIPTVTTSKRVATKSINSNKVKSYYVKNGDTLYSISRKFNIKVSDIKAFNNIKNNLIQIGDKLVFKY